MVALLLERTLGDPEADTEVILPFLFDEWEGTVDGASGKKGLRDKRKSSIRVVQKGGNEEQNNYVTLKKPALRYI